MPLILAGQTEGWKLHLQLTNGQFIRANPGERVRLAGATSTSPVLTTNDSTHLFVTDDHSSHICTTTHGNNTKRLTSSTVSINGAGSSSLPVAVGSCPILLSFFTLDEVQTSGGQIYSYNGTTDSVPMPGVNLYLAEGGSTSTWVQAHGSGSPLTLADQSDPSVEHNWYIAMSTEAAGGSTIATGALKITINYI